MAIFCLRCQLVHQQTKWCWFTPTLKDFGIVQNVDLLRLTTLQHLSKGQPVAVADAK